MNPLLSETVPFFSRRSMAVTSIGESIYFFGGVGARGTESILDVSADLWCFDTKALSWREIDRSGLWPSSRRCVGFESKESDLLLWGGSGIASAEGGGHRHDFLNDFWRFNSIALEWELISDSQDHRSTPSGDEFPFPRYTPVFHVSGDELFLFGGYTEDRIGKRKLNDAWIRSAGKWRQVPFYGKQGYFNGADWPGLRYGSMSAADAQNIYVCGGFSDEGDHIDLWRFDMARKCWGILSPDGVSSEFPAPRYCAAFMLYEQKLYLFGGRSRAFPKLNFNDLWEFDLDSKRWSMVFDNRAPHSYGPDADSPGYHAKSSSVLVGDFWYLWGGEGIRGHVSDFWRFDLKLRNWQLLQSARRDDPIFW